MGEWGNVDKEWGVPVGSKVAHLFKDFGSEGLYRSYCQKVITFCFSEVSELTSEKIPFCSHCKRLSFSKGGSKK